MNKKIDFLCVGNMLILKFDLDNRRQDNYHGQPQIQSLATQLQKQKIAPDGPSGYSKFKQEYGQVRKFTF